MEENLIRIFAMFQKEENIRRKERQQQPLEENFKFNRERKSFSFVFVLSDEAEGKQIDSVEQPLFVIQINSTDPR